MKNNTSQKTNDYSYVNGYFTKEGFHPYPSESSNKITCRFTNCGLDGITPNVLNNIPFNGDFSQIQSIIKGNGIFNLLNNKVFVMKSFNSPIDFSRPYTPSGIPSLMSTNQAPYRALPLLANLGQNLVVNYFENSFQEGLHPLSPNHLYGSNSVLAANNKSL